MKASEKEEISVLLRRKMRSSNREDSSSTEFSTRFRSASMSIRSNTLDGIEKNSVEGFTEPLRGRGQTLVIHMSDPLYSSQNHEVTIEPPSVTLEQQAVEMNMETGASNRVWPVDGCEFRNEHLMKSGQLGMCNDPYCTSCPTIYHDRRSLNHARIQNLLDAKYHNLLYGDARGCAKRMCSFIRSYIPGIVNPHAKITQRWNRFLVVSCLFAIFVDPLFFFPLLTNQIIILVILPYSKSATTASANSTKNLLRTAILAQYFPKLYRFYPLLAGQTPTGFIFESALSNFIINLLMFILAGHVIGSTWYLLTVQRVNQCLRNACHSSNIAKCMEFIDCGHGDVSKFTGDATWGNWQNNTNASACFAPGGSFAYGIYQNGVVLTTYRSVGTRYVYSLFWGFQQISTLAGNQVPSYFVWEVLFTMAIIVVGLLLFALLIGNMQNFLQSLDRRRLEMSLRHRDVEQWMRHRRLPEDLWGQVREAERFNWAATRGVDEEMLMENLPEDLQRDIRRHLFKFVERVRIFQLLDDAIIDAICERLRTRTFIKGGKIFFPGGLIDKMVFIIRGKMESIGEDQIVVPLSEGDVCGEELLTWCLEHSSSHGDRKRVRILLSNRMLRCLTNVEAFVLRAADLEEITSLFARFLRSPRVQSAIRYESPYWRLLAARRIQVAWRYRKKRLSRLSGDV